MSVSSIGHAAPASTAAAIHPPAAKHAKPAVKQAKAPAPSAPARTLDVKA